MALLSPTRTAAVPDQIKVTTVCRAVPFSDPLDIYRTLAERFGERQVFLLESLSGRPDDNHYAFVGLRPLLSVSVTRGQVDIAGVPGVAGAVRAATSDVHLADPEQLWDLLRRVNGVFAAEGSTDRFTFGFLTFFGYDTARYIERLPYLIERRPAEPDVSVVLYQCCVRLDLLARSAELLVHQSDSWDDLPVSELETLLKAVKAEETPPDICPPVSCSDELTQEQFGANVERCLRHIGIGDIYQVQIGHDIVVRSPAEPLDVYRRLRARNPSPYMYLCPLGDQTLVGASPELFVRVTDGEIAMRPIAGTAPRPGGREEQLAATRLRNDPKEIAEHVMLVDLCRNDIGRVCRRDTLATGELLAIEAYSHVLHLVSTVTGRLDDVADGFDVIRALFPAGTMTGAPKIRAMEIIESVESSRRGMYSGAIGLVDVGGHVNLGLVIRTLFHSGDRYRIRASAGVVADSVPEREWRETLVKMSAPYWAVTDSELPL